FRLHPSRCRRSHHLCLTHPSLGERSSEDVLFFRPEEQFSNQTQNPPSVWSPISLSARLLLDLQGELARGCPTKWASLLRGHSRRCERSLVTRSERPYAHSRPNCHSGSAFALEPNSPRFAVGPRLLACDP